MRNNKEHVEEAPTAAPYAEPWHHLQDELAYLDLLIRLRITRRHYLDSNDPLVQLKGLVLSDDEIDALLETPAAGVDGIDTNDSVNDTVNTRASANGKRNDAQTQEIISALTALEIRMESRRAASMAQQGSLLALPYLAQLFQLSRFEERCLLICLAPEINSKYDKLYAYMQDDVTRKRPSVDLVLNLIYHAPEDKLAARVMFEAQASLRKYRLVQVFEPPSTGPLPLLTRFLKLDDRIVNFLLGNSTVDARLGDWARLVYTDDNYLHDNSSGNGSYNGSDDSLPGGKKSLQDFPGELGEKLREFVNTNYHDGSISQRKVLFYVEGRYGAGKHTLARTVANTLQLPLLVCDAGRVPGDAMSVSDALWLAAREAFLQPAVFCIENFHHLSLDETAHRAELRALCEAVETFSQLTFVLSERPWVPRGLLKDAVFIALKLPLPDGATRIGLWRESMQGYSVSDDVDLGAIASQFSFTPGQIRDALITARHAAYWRSPKNENISQQDLYCACRAQSNPKLSELTRKIEPNYAWRDIILPADSYEQLQDICKQARNRHVVMGQWGFGRKLSLGKGLAVMFSGPPGTGKTMAAEVVARELEVDLYKVDLSQVVSKYIGETEKNLDQIFNAAEHANAILFFDEADALFGKRSEVRDSHDRYANVEVSYLLQKMEEYEGISILATNLRKHMDDAFLRRLQSVIEFPFPDTAHREQIWRVTFPDEAPLGDDVDIAALAQHIRLSGGNIKNIGLNAAFYAASDGGVIRMPHLLQAAQREHKKLGRTWVSPAGAAGIGASIKGGIGSVA